jgi:hypothetical protein
MSDRVTAFPIPLRAASQPLGLYLRVGHTGHRELETVLLSGPQKIFGAVIDATSVEQQKDLKEQLLANNLDVILDPKTQAAAFAGGFRPSMSKLPWGTDRPTQHDDFRDLLGRQRIIKLAESIVANSFTQALAPTHFLMSPNDAWFGIDVECTRWLRAELDRRGGKRVPIIYSLAIANPILRDADQRSALITRLADLPIDSLWLKVDNFGADVGAMALARFMEAVVDFHKLGVPIIADHVGGVPALGLLAFGTVGGIAHGVTAGERFSSYNWRNPKASSGGGGGWRIYCPPLGIMLSRKEAELLFASSPRAKGLFANRNAAACPRGLDDMLAHPVRAFVVQRADEVASLSAVPDNLRPQHFLEKSLRPMTDCSVTATKIRFEGEDGRKLGERLARHRKHVEDLRVALGNRAERTPPQSLSLQPPTRIVRECKK